MVLSLLALMFYSAILPKSQPVANQYDIKNSSSVTKINEPLPSSFPAEKEAPQPKALTSSISTNSNELYKIETVNTIFTFSKTGAFLLDAFDKKSRSDIDIKNIGFVQEWSSYHFDFVELPRGIEFSGHADDGSSIKKTFRVKDDETIELTISINNITSNIIKSYNILAGYFSPPKSTDPLSLRYQEAFCDSNGVILRKAVHGLKRPYEFNDKISWLGLRDRYFCVVFYPQLIVNKGVVENIDKSHYFAISVPARTMPGGSASVEDTFNIYVGPQDEQLLKRFAPSAEKVVNFGMFDPISKILLFLLDNTHKLLKNWGLCIIVMTLFIYFLLFPLSLKSMLSMKKLQALQPKIEELRAKYKDNPHKLQMETMDLYKKEKVNPFGGCLPMLLQIPVFFALYQLLMRMIDLKGASFLWIKDLSAPDRLLLFKNTFPIIGNELNLLPLLMAGVMFLYRLSRLDEILTADQQKMMSIVMPVLFGVLFYKMPSGLVLYWFINSLLMTGFQWKISRAKA